MEKNKDDGLNTIMQFNIIGNQVNVSTDNGLVNANQTNEAKVAEKYIRIENKPKNYIRDQNRKGGEVDDGIILLAGLALIFAVGWYIQYRWKILFLFIVISLLIELLTCIIYYKGKKERILYDKNIQQIGIFNMIFVWVIPLLICIINSPIYNNKIDFADLKQQIKINGLVHTYFTNSSEQYAMFQMIGLFFMGGFLLYIIWTDLYIIAVLNVVRGKKGQWFWKCLLKWTCGKSRVGGKHIKIGLIWIFISIIMAPFQLPL